VEDKLVVLVIEDDPDIQAVIEDVLTDGGFDPAIAPPGEEAVTLLRGTPSTYCALVTDINLRGGMTGWDIARQVREIDPAFPIVYMTGAAAHQWGSQGFPTAFF
jgi:CheY-like chemotaxis protein